jgi:hypothetical protein
LLKKGLVWRVRDGCSVKIWEDKLMDVLTTYSIQSLVREPDEGARISELVDADTKWWDRALIEIIFMEDEATKICGIAICPNKQHVQLIWAGNKNGEFTMRHVYHLTKWRHELEEGGCSNPRFTNTLWKVIWKLKVTRAVKVFILKAYSNILPTKENLFK